MRDTYYYEALQEAITEEMRRDKRVFLTGEGVGIGGISTMPPYTEIVKEFGENRVRETGIIEQMLAGGSAGAAMCGFRPIVDFLHADFMFPAWNEILDAGLWRSGHGAADDLSVPVVFMSTIMSYGGGGYSHARAPIANVWHGPGIKLVLPTTPYDAKGLMKTAVRDDNPVVFLTHRLLLRQSGSVPTKEYVIPFGEANIRREGKDVTIVAISYMVNLSLEAAETLQQEGISTEIIDPCTLEPLDIGTILASVEKTGRLVVVDEDYIRCGVGAEIAFQVQEKLMKYLKAPIQRIGNLNTPIPVARSLMDAVMPTKQKIMDTVKKTLN